MINNENIIKLSGSANIDRELKLGYSFLVTANVEVTKVEQLNNQDGSFNQKHICKLITVSIEKENGEMTQTKDLRSNSELFRKACWKVWHDKNMSCDQDTFYNYAVRRSMGFLDAFADDFGKLSTL